MAGVTQQKGHRVQLLSDSLIDQIAAGEVVERPASVVKELVENALDAEATRIRIEIRNGGSSLISVADDGMGMSRGDARMALRRHATSKLQRVDDLLRIGSFGFRGEALPAIASVSRLRLSTRLQGASEGWEIRIQAGEILEERAAGGPEGTRIEVADLFAAIPARRKFLKKPATEWGHISDWLGRLALAMPGAHFEVQRDDRPALVWPATSDPMDRIAAVLGGDVAGRLVPIQSEQPDGHIEAYVSGPEHTRANASGLYLFANGRPVRDPLLRHALLDAYRDLLPRGRFPTGLVFVTVPPEALDVNVHPAKWEVRFAEPQAIHRLVRDSVRAAMAERRWLEPSATDASWRGVRPAGATHGRGEEAPTGTSAEPSASSSRTPERSDWVFAAQPPLLGDSDRAAGGDDPPLVVEDRAAEPLHFGSLRRLGQLLASYLLVEGKRGLILVDQHAAHERFLYEQLRAEWLANGVSSQPLLLPETVEVDALALAALLEATELCERLGFDLAAFGDRAVLVRAIPSLLAGRDPGALVRGLAEELRGGEPGGEGTATVTGAAPSDVRLVAAADRVFATLACHSARRFGEHLDAAEQQAILSGLDDIPWAPTCPHGRPVAVAVDIAEIERRFGRR